MKELLYKSMYREIFYHRDKNMMLMNYFEASSGYSDEDYKKEEIIFRDLLDEKGAISCYVDTLNFNYIITPEIQKWVTEIANSVLREDKLKKLAVLVSENLFTDVSVRQMADKFEEAEENTCQIQHFTSKKSAITWLFE